MQECIMRDNKVQEEINKEIEREKELQRQRAKRNNNNLNFEKITGQNSIENKLPTVFLKK